MSRSLIGSSNGIDLPDSRDRQAAIGRGSPPVPQARPDQRLSGPSSAPGDARRSRRSPDGSGLGETKRSSLPGSVPPERRSRGVRSNPTVSPGRPASPQPSGSTASRDEPLRRNTTAPTRAETDSACRPDQEAYRHIEDDPADRWVNEHRISNGSMIAFGYWERRDHPRRSSRLREEEAPPFQAPQSTSFLLTPREISH